MATVEAEWNGGMRDLTAEQGRAMGAALAIWIPLVLVSPALLAAGAQEYSSLHIALDMAMALLPAVLAWLLWHIGRRINRRFPQLVSVAFALAALMNCVHLLAGIEWPGNLATGGAEVARRKGLRGWLQRIFRRSFEVRYDVLLPEEIVPDSELEW